MNAHNNAFPTSVLRVYMLLNTHLESPQEVNGELHKPADAKWVFRNMYTLNTEEWKRIVVCIHISSVWLFGLLIDNFIASMLLHMA